jgi:DNA-binding LacI/PurR family transcriptional regulator
MRRYKKDPRQPMPAGRRVTALDVARLAGVSRSAVSRAFTPGASISKEARERVLRAADQLGYQPNLIARSLMTRRSQLIVLVMAQLRNPFFTEMLGLFNRRFRERGYQTLLLSVDDGLTADDIIDNLFQYQPEGAVLVSCSPTPELSQRCARFNIPIVYMDRSSPQAEETASRVWVSDRALGVKVAEHLLAENRRRIAFIAGHPDEPLSELAQAFVDTVTMQDDATLVQECGQYSYELGYQAALRLLRGANPPDGIFCVADSIALGALDAARMVMNIDVPDQLSIIGFSDIAAASWRSTGLTTVRLPIESLVNEATDMLLKQIDSPQIARQQILLDCPIIERRTTTPVAESA